MPIDAALEESPKFSEQSIFRIGRRLDQGAGILPPTLGAHSEQAFECGIRAGRKEVSSINGELLTSEGDQPRKIPEPTYAGRRKQTECKALSDLGSYPHGPSLLRAFRGRNDPSGGFNSRISDKQQKDGFNGVPVAHLAERYIIRQGIQ